MPRLVVQNNQGSGEVYELDGNVVTIGRDPESTIVLDDLTVSNHHAEIIRHAEGVLLRDLDSANGTTLNGQVIVEANIINGDVVAFGGLQATFFVDAFVSEKTLPVVRAQTLQVKHRKLSIVNVLGVFLVLCVVAGIILSTVQHSAAGRRESRPTYVASKAIPNSNVGTTAPTTVDNHREKTADADSAPPTAATPAVAPLAVAPPTSVVVHSEVKENANSILTLDSFPRTPLTIDKRLIQAIPAEKLEQTSYGDPVSRYLSNFNVTKSRPTGNERYDDDHTEYHLNYRSSETIGLQLMESYAGSTLDDAGSGAYIKHGRSFVGGDRYFEIVFTSGEVQQFLPLFIKYNDWLGASAKSHLGEGIEKEIGKVGNHSISFITPDKLKLGSFVMNNPDVQLLVDAICALPQLKSDIETEITNNIRESQAAVEKTHQDADATKLKQDRANAVLK